MAAIIGLIASLVTLLAVYLWACRLIKPGRYTFETERGSFELDLARYTKATEFIVPLDTGVIALLLSSSFFRNGTKYIGAPVVMIATSAALLVLFVGFTTFFYGDWKYHPDLYTHKRYRAIVAFGLAGVLCFAIGYVWMAVVLCGLKPQ